jgi:hypothetical protein
MPQHSIPRPGMWDARMFCGSETPSDENQLKDHCALLRVLRTANSLRWNGFR